jgi:hypothetical protein
MTGWVSVFIFSTLRAWYGRSSVLCFLRAAVLKEDGEEQGRGIRLMSGGIWRWRALPFKLVPI